MNAPCKYDEDYVERNPQAKRRDYDIHAVLCDGVRGLQLPFDCGRMV